MGLKDKILAFKRKNDIDCIKTEKESLKRILIDALMYRGNLNMVQRSQVLSEIVDEWKSQEEERLFQERLKYLEAEESNDIAKNILNFN